MVRGLNLWNDRRVFQAFLKGIRSARPYLTEGGVQFILYGVNPCRRHKILRRIRQVDPEGHKAFWRLARRLRRHRVKVEETFNPIKEAIAANKVAVAERVWEKEGVTQFRFVQADSMLDIMAHFLAAGYSRREVAEKLKVDLQFVAQVTPEMIQSVKRRLPDSIILAAEQKVYKDLMEGKIEKDTERADRISTRRRKLILDAARILKERAPPPPSSLDAREKEYTSRFGVERKAIDVASTESEKPEEAK